MGLLHSGALYGWSVLYENTDDVDITDLAARETRAAPAPGRGVRVRSMKVANNSTFVLCTR